MEIDFENRTVLVTGAVRGIGRGIAHAFAALGATVHAADIEAEELEKIVSEASPARGGRIEPHRLDVTNSTAVNALIDEIGSIDIVVHSAGGVRSRPKVALEDVTDDDWRVIQQVNVDGAFNIARAVTPSMKRAEKGRIIVISSKAGLGVSRTGIQSYGTAKAAQIGLVRQLAAELGPFGITVNSVAPGFMPTSPDYVRQWESYGADGQQALIDSIAMRRVGTPEDIANAVLFLASDYAGWITGQTLPVCGGP